MHRIGIIRRISAGLFLALASTVLVLGVRAIAAEPPRPVIAVGDLHGDYDAYISILRAAGLVSARGKWSGGKAILVQLGDVPDRGSDTRKIIEHLMKLEKEAKKKGGRVVPLIGNHEAMNVIGDLRYVTPEEYAAFATAKSKKLRDAHFKANFAALAEFYRKKDPTLTMKASELLSRRRRSARLYRASPRHGAPMARSARGSRRMTPPPGSATRCSCMAGSAWHTPPRRSRQINEAVRAR